MAGFMTKHMGYVYEGEYTNGDTTPMENGIFVVIDGAQMKTVAAADATIKLLCKGVETIFDGRTAYRFQVLSHGAEQYYFVFDETDYDDTTDYNTATYAVQPGAYVKAHPIVPGEEFITTAVAGTPVVGTVYGLTAAGLVG